jgi:uncharacterized protein DUF4268
VVKICGQTRVHVNPTKGRQVMSPISWHKPLFSQSTCSPNHLYHKSISDDKDLFDFLLAKKDEIEKELGIKLDWQRLPEETKASRIKIAKKFDIVGNADFSKYGEAFSWLEKNLDNFKKVFSKYLVDYK